MAEKLLTVDRVQLRRLPEADSLQLLGELISPAQACRAVFLAARVGAIEWDRTKWPDLAFGVWSDGESADGSGGGRRRARAESAELTTWLQLRPDWPQLGGASIAWPAGPQLASDFEGRAAAVVDDAVAALNATYARAVQMSVALTGAVAVAASAPVARPAGTAQLTGARPAPSAERAFTGARVAHGEDQIAAVLADLARDAEIDASARHIEAALLHVDHAVTPLSPVAGALNGNGHSANGRTSSRWLVSLTATVRANSRH